MLVPARAQPLVPDARTIRAALDAGEYDRAEQLALNQSDAALVVEARLKNGRARDPELLRLAKDNVRAQEQRSPSEPASLARALNVLGALHTERGEYAEALVAHQRATSVAAALGEDDPLVGDGLDGETLAYIRLEKFREAQSPLDRALHIRAVHASLAPLAMARTLYLAALLDRYNNNYAGAIETVEQARALWRAHAPDDPDSADLTIVLGEVSFLRGDMSSARDAWASGLALATRSLRPDHPAIARLLRRVAIAARAVGALQESRTLLTRAQEIVDHEFAACDPDAAGVLNDRALALRYDGDYAQARRLFSRALEITTKCLGPKHSSTVGIVYNQGILAQDIGDFGEARRFYQSAVDAWTSTLGPDHPYVARGIRSLALVAKQRGDLLSAERLYQRVLSIQRDALDPLHPDVALTLSDLAQLEMERGSLPLAHQRIKEAESIYRRSAAPLRPGDLPSVLLSRGEIEMRERDFQSARATFDEARAMRERILGASHLLTAEAGAAVASADFALGNYASAASAGLEAERVSRAFSQATIRYLPERQAMMYAASRPHGLDLALSAVSGAYVTDLTPIADAVVRSRGVVLDELAARAHGRVADATLLTARQKFANLTLRSLDGSDPSLLRLLDAVRREKEDAERAFAEHERTGPADLPTLDAGLREVQAALPERSALVAFSRYQRSVPASTSLTPSYIALIIKPGDAEVRAVTLGAARTLDDLINTWRTQARARDEPTYREVADRMRRRIWDPLLPTLVGVSRVFIVPDGAINFVTFAALPASRGKYLLETGPVFHYVTAERDLIRPAPATANTGLLAIGGPAFDDAPIGRGATASLRAGCAPAGSMTFADLPGTRDEILDVARIWRSTGDTTTLLSGTQATKRATIGALSKRRVVHLATHGFFLDSNCRPTAPSPTPTRAVGGLVSSSSRRTVDASPLVLSGLALAGANNAAKRPAADDGILTAEEVASLDITGTEWVVLSACDTGLGEIAVGEGVVGLRRAFHIAGARTVIMSLWSVEDQSARAWMRELYRARFARHLTTSDAMRTAALRVLDGRRARGESSHPFYWAGFVAVGDWR